MPRESSGVLLGAFMPRSIPAMGHHPATEEFALPGSPASGQRVMGHHGGYALAPDHHVLGAPLARYSVVSCEPPTQGVRRSRPGEAASERSAVASGFLAGYRESPEVPDPAATEAAQAAAKLERARQVLATMPDAVEMMKAH
jgi:hypothetical protein